MKQTFLSRPCYAGAASAALSLALFLLAGCSGGEGSQGSEENVATVGNLGFNKSESLALRKAGTGRKDLERAIMEKKIEQLKQRGIDVEIVGPGKKTKNRR